MDDSGKFWRWAKLCVDVYQFPSQAADLLTSGVLYLVPEICLSSTIGPGNANVESLLRAISEGKTPLLKELAGSVFSHPLAHVSPGILAGAAVNLEGLRAGLSSLQLEAILTRIARSQDSKLRKLKWGYHQQISGFDPDILAEAIVKLEKAEFWGGRMTAEQINAILTMLGGNMQGRLKEIKIVCPRVAGSVSQTLLQQARLNNDVRIDVNI